MTEATANAPLALATLRAGQRLRGLVPGRARVNLDAEKKDED